MNVKEEEVVDCDSKPWKGGEDDSNDNGGNGDNGDEDGGEDCKGPGRDREVDHPVRPEEKEGEDVADEEDEGEEDDKEAGAEVGKWQ